MVRSGCLNVLIEEEIVDPMGEAAGDARILCKFFADAFAMLMESLTQLGDDAIEFFGRLRGNGLVSQFTDIAIGLHEFPRMANG
ncbi:MAG: hypothetical protein WA886_20065 [Candidatus Acidiferrales bacterium]